MQEYRFALRPRWIAGHLVVVALAMVLVNLGLWQLRRLDDRRVANARVLEGSRTIEPLDAVVSPAGRDLPDHARFRRVEVRGTFDPAKEALIRFRTRSGLPGYEVLTPLVVRPGVAVLIDRGWLPLALGDAPRPPPPAGEATVTGLLLPGEGSARFQPAAGVSGGLVVGAVHVPGLEERLGYDLYPGFVQLQNPDDPSTYPVPLPQPDLGQGPHLTYAMQWFAFSAIAVVGWGLLVRQSARRRQPPSIPST